MLALCLLASGAVAGPPDRPTPVADRRAADPLAAPGEQFKPRLGALQYRIVWRGVTAGDIVLNKDFRDNRHTLSLRGESNEHIDRVYRVRYQAISQMSANPFLPLRAVYRENVQNDRKHFQLDFHPDGTVSVTRDRQRPGREPSADRYELRPGLFAADPLAGLVLLMKTDWREGMTLQFEVLSGKDRFLASLRCVGRARLTVMDIRREAWVLSLTMTEITEGANSAKQEPEHEPVRIFVSNDPFREILRLEGHTPLGEVQARLHRFSPLKTR